MSFKPVRIQYWFDSYGVIWQIRKPKDVEGLQTDENGELIVKLADYSGAIDIWVENRIFRFNKKVIYNGGTLDGFVSAKYKTDKDEEIILRLIPLAK